MHVLVCTKLVNLPSFFRPSRSGCIPAASSTFSWNCGSGTRSRSRKPITALAANGFWSGVSDIKDVLFTSTNPLLGETARSVAVAVLFSNSSTVVVHFGKVYIFIVPPIKVLYRQVPEFVARSGWRLRRGGRVPVL